MEILERSLIEQILDEAMEVLDQLGVLVEHPQAFARLQEAGLPGNEKTHRITFPRERVEAAIESAPSAVRLYDRAGALHSTLEGDRVHFVPASSALQVLDRSTGESRDPTSADFIEYVKVGDRLRHIDYLSTAFSPKDVPQEIGDAWRLYLALAYSKKPVVSGAFTAEGVALMGEIMQLFRADRKDLADRPMSIFTCCPTTPLRWGEDSITNLIDCAEWGIPIEVVPVLLLGMISPVTTVGALVLHTAEVLSGVTLSQTIRPGCPVIFGGAPAAFHMRLMTNPMSAVEAHQIFCGYAQIADYLELPSQAYMGLSDSKFNDSQAGAETGIGIFLAALSGINTVSGPGMLEYVNCFSLQKLMFDDELVGHVKHFLRQVEIKDDLPTRPLLEQLLEESHLLTAEHTLERWPQELYLPGPMVDRTNRDQWQEQGSMKFDERANELIDEALFEYDSAPISEDLHTEIRERLARGCETKDVDLPRSFP